MSENRAAWQSDFGGPELIEIVDLPVPEPEAGQVRVRVAAAGLNPVDWKIPAHPEAARLFGAQVPGGYGNDFAGTVDAVGEGVTQWHVGDQVFGGARGHAVAQQILVPTKGLTPVPNGLDLDVAATLQIAGLTAVAALEPLHLGPEDTVLIGGGAGGVGVLTVQLAVQTGAIVLATASAANHDFLAGLGAVPVAYGEHLVANVRAATQNPITAVVDLQGPETVKAGLDLGVAPDRIVSIVPGDLPEGVIETWAADAPEGAVAEVAQQVADGRLKVEIAGRYPLDQIAEAVTRLRDGHVRGKLVIELDQD